MPVSCGRVSGLLGDQAALSCQWFHSIAQRIKGLSFHLHRVSQSNFPLDLLGPSQNAHTHRRLIAGVAVGSGARKSITSFNISQSLLLLFLIIFPVAAGVAMPGGREIEVRDDVLGVASVSVFIGAILIRSAAFSRTLMNCRLFIPQVSQSTHTHTHSGALNRLSARPPSPLLFRVSLCTCGKSAFHRAHVCHDTVLH